MKTMIGSVALAVGFLPFVGAFGTQADVGTAPKEITTLVKTFQSSISTKDGDKLQTLFLPNGSNWWSVLDEGTYATVKKKHPGASRLVSGDFRKFANFIKTTAHSPNEEFTNVRIQTDGMVGTVYFDYKFFLDSKQTNHGVEIWQVLKTDDGWKISALTYSEIHEKAS